VSSTPVVLARDVRLRVRKCDVCQASKHSLPTETAGRRRLHAGRPWQVVAVDLVSVQTPLTVSGILLQVRLSCRAGKFLPGIPVMQAPPISPCGHFLSRQLTRVDKPDWTPKESSQQIRWLSWQMVPILLAYYSKPQHLVRNVTPEE